VAVLFHAISCAFSHARFIRARQTGQKKDGASKVYSR